jgi:hypothetical protein
MSSDHKPVENGNIAFGIGLHASSDWPESCNGAYKVLEGLQRMLEAASQGKRHAFKDAKGDVEDYLYDWQTELFGINPFVPTDLEEK